MTSYPGVQRMLGRQINMVAERSFCAVMAFATFLVILPYSVGFVLIPEWTRLSIGLCWLGVLFVGVNYHNEYLGRFALSYSKFSSTGQIPPRLGWSVIYATPALIYIVAWYLVGAPQSTFQLAALVTYVGHFLKRIMECLFVHKYSKKVQAFSAVVISMFYSVGTVVQHYWCNIYSSPELAHKLSANRTTIILGSTVFIVGELVCFYHHALLAGLRSPQKSAEYVIPHGGLFSFLVCPHYFGELIAWYGISMVGQHLGIYMAWLAMVAYLAGRSHQTLLWYKSKMDGFPTDRRNLFPGIF